MKNEISLIERLPTSRLQNIIYGVLLSDGYIDDNYRFDLFNKNAEYTKYVYQVLNQVTGLNPSYNEKFDKRYNKVMGYRTWTKSNHPYLRKLREKCYIDREKYLNESLFFRLTPEALAHIWMCDGYLEVNKNRAANKVQNIGYFCLESFHDYELRSMIEFIDNTYGIKCTLNKCAWGKGFRIRLGGLNLQKFISLIYPFILPVFSYKAELYYKEATLANPRYVDFGLPNAEHIFKTYENCEDIVRSCSREQR